MARFCKRGLSGLVDLFPKTRSQDNRTESCRTLLELFLKTNLVTSFDNLQYLECIAWHCFETLLQDTFARHSLWSTPAQDALVGHSGTLLKNARVGRSVRHSLKALLCSPLKLF